MYEEILTDLKKSFGPRVLLTPEDIAPLIVSSPAVQANMRASGTFPLPVRKIGRRVGVTIYHLAEYLANGAVVSEANKPSSSLLPLATKVLTKRKIPIRKRETDWLLAMQTQINFQAELVINVKRVLLARSLPEAKRRVKGRKL
jgi:hypothetical protein